jgi:hypothetical protein
MTSNITQALETLNNLIGKGWEYPDAHAKAVTLHKVDADELAAAYDNQGE